jgi:hypothetical protein
VRQLSAPGRRTAVWIAASLAVLASAGCMSVSDDESRKPAVSTSPDGDGAVAEPDGGHVPPGGHGRRGAGGDSTGQDAKNGSASPSPSGSASAEPEPTRPGQQPPASEPSAPSGGASPSASRSSAPPPAQESPEPPAESPPPSEPEPSDPPSASSAPEVHIGAMREVDHPSGAQAEPAASPQPGAADGAGRAGGDADEGEADGAGRPSAA